MGLCLNCMKTYDDQFDICPHCGFVKGTPPREAYHLHPGMILANRYIIGTVLGFGGFGVTYRAWDSTLSKMLAIKEFYPNGIVNRIPGEKDVIIYSGKRKQEFLNGKTRFLDEARNMAKFSTHPNIVHVHDFFEENHTAYIAMEFLDGISYKKYIADCGGKVDVDTAVGVVQAVLSALKEIHRNKIIHRDISPDNIFICADGRIKLIDFGAARFTTGEEEKTMSIILKPGYAPPEQYRSKSRQGPWTDIYAVGAVMYRSLTGTMPEESVNRQIEDTLIAPRELNPDIPDDINNAIKRAMALDWQLRFRNVDEFSQALTSDKPVLDDQGELKRRKKRRRLCMGLIAASICAAAGICFGVYQKKAMEARLAPAQVLVWVPSEEGQDTGSSFETMISEFRSNNSQISLDVRYVPEEEYGELLEKALKEGNGPDLFDSSDLDGAVTEKLADLTSVVPPEEQGDYYFLDQYETYFPEKKQIPLSLEVPVIYGNQMIAELPAALDGAEDLKADGVYSYTVSGRYLEILEMAGAGAEAAGLLQNESSADGYQAFREKKTAYYLSDTSDFRQVQEDMAGIYQMRILDQTYGGDLTYGSFSNLWSVNGQSAPEVQAAACRMIYYMLSERAQLELCVRGKDGLPVNRKAFATYESLNATMSGLGEKLSEYDF
ncbi:MAG: protein kinase [Enterocloster sp.]